MSLQQIVGNAALAQLLHSGGSTRRRASTGATDESSPAPPTAVQRDLPGAPATTDVFIDAGGIDDAAMEFAQIHKGPGSQIIGMNEGFCKFYNGETGRALSPTRWQFSKVLRVPPGVWFLDSGKFHRLVQDKAANYSPHPIRTFPMLGGKEDLNDLIRADQSKAFNEAVHTQLTSSNVFLIVPRVPKQFLAPPKPHGSGDKPGEGKGAGDKSGQGKGVGDKSGDGKGGTGDKTGSGNDARDQAGSPAGNDTTDQAGVPNGSERDTIDREAKAGGVKIIGDALPSRIDGLDLQSLGGQGDYEVKLQYSAAGADLLSQVAAAMAAYHYHWEMLDITNAVGADERAKAEAAAKAAKQGSGKEVTGGDVASREMKTAATETLQDDTHIFQDMGHLHPSALVNYELMPITNLVELAGSSITAVGDYLSEDIDSSTKIPWPKKEGYFLLRSLVVPPVVETKDGTRQRLPTSVATKIVEVRSPDYLVKNAEKEADADVREAEAALLAAQKSGDPKAIEKAQKALDDINLQAGGDASAVLRRQIEIVTKKHDDAVAEGQNGTAKELEDELKSLQNRLGMADDRAKKGTTFRPKATLVSNVTGKTYPLLFQLIKNGGGKWTLSDVTSDTGNVKSASGKSDRDTIHHLFDEFGRDAPWGRGTISVTLPKDAYGTAEQWTVESAERDLAMAKRSIEDLVKVLVILGLFVPGVGEAAAIIGGVTAAAHLVERYANGNLRPDMSAADDVLAVLIAATTGAQAISELRLVRIENKFAMALKDAPEDAIKEAQQAMSAASDVAALTAKINSIAGNAFMAWGIAEGSAHLVQVAQDEEAGRITHSEARKARADFAISMLQNAAMVIGPGLAAKPKDRATAHDETKTKTPDETKATGEAKQTGGATRRFDDLPELRKGLPADLASSLSITVDRSEKFGSATVQVEYTPDGWAVKDIRLRVGEQASAKEIAEHVNTIRAMQRYEGLSGRLRALIERIRAWFKGNPLAGPGTRAWEARLELLKLPPIIEARAREMADPATSAERRSALELEINDLESQLAKHATDVDSVEAGQGFVAAESKGSGDTADAAKKHGPTETKDQTPFRDRPEVKKGFAKADQEHKASGAEGPSPSARFDAVLATLKQKGLDSPGLREIEKMLNPGQGQDALSGGRLLHALDRLETLAALVRERPDLLTEKTRGDVFNSIEKIAGQVSEAYGQGKTLEGRKLSTPQSPELKAAMDALRADLDTYRKSSGSDPIERQMALIRVRDQVARAQEILRSYGEGFTSHSTAGETSASKTVTGIKEQPIETSASGQIFEPLARDLPGVGLEGYMLRPEELAELKTIPPGVGARLAKLLRGYQRAHLVGPGFGSELFEGMMLAPADVNLRAQNDGVERLVRNARAAGVEITLETKATGRRFIMDLEGGSTQHVDVLTEVEYTIHGQIGDGDEVTHKITIKVTDPPNGHAEIDPEGARLLKRLEKARAAGRPGPLE